jgi:hypothetical protein
MGARFAAGTEEKPVDKGNKIFSYSRPKHVFSASELYESRSDLALQISDARVVRLLLVLHELDEAVDGLEYLLQVDLSNLISSAVLACGFVSPAEAQYAIAAVLRVIQGHEPIPGSGCMQQG